MVKPIKKYDFELHMGASKEIFSNALLLCKEMTQAEIELWQALRDRKLSGFKFRRQHPLKHFIADFYCHKAKLVIEVDGEIHQQAANVEHDAGRAFELEKLGIRIIRFSNKQVLTELEIVLNEIEKELRI